MDTFKISCWIIKFSSISTALSDWFLRSSILALFCKSSNIRLHSSKESRRRIAHCPQWCHLHKTRCLLSSCSCFSCSVICRSTHFRFCTLCCIRRHLFCYRHRIVRNIQTLICHCHTNYFWSHAIHFGFVDSRISCY